MKRTLAWDSKRTKDRAAGKYVRDKDCPYYNTARWHNLSRVWRAQHPLCEECKRQGRITAGEVADHIIPWPICKDFFFSESNLQTLCARCNNLKGQKDKERIRAWRAEHPNQ